MTLRHMIDLATVRPNPDAGATEIIDPIYQGTDVEGDDRVAAVLADIADKLLVSEHREDFRRKRTICRWRLTSVDAALCERLRQAGASYKHEVAYHRYGLMTPLPAYLFKFLPLEVECDDCHARFDAGDLVNDVADDGEGGESYCPTVCPKCGAPKPEKQLSTFSASWPRQAPCRAPRAPAPPRRPAAGAAARPARAHTAGTDASSSSFVLVLALDKQTDYEPEDDDDRPMFM